MRVNQTIRVGTISINSMSNSAILQVGTSGAIKARSEEITEQVSQQQTDQQLEQKIQKEMKPPLNKQGLSVESKAEQQLTGGSQEGQYEAAQKAKLAGGVTSSQEQAQGPIQNQSSPVGRKNRT